MQCRKTVQTRFQTVEGYGSLGRQLQGSSIPLRGPFTPAPSQRTHVARLEIESSRTSQTAGWLACALIVLPFCPFETTNKLISDNTTTVVWRYGVHGVLTSLLLFFCVVAAAFSFSAETKKDILHVFFSPSHHLQVGIVTCVYVMIRFR